MDAALAWLLWLDRDERRIVFARALGVPWRRLEDQDGRSERTLRSRHRDALEAITCKLNQAVRVTMDALAQPSSPRGKLPAT